MIVVTTTKAREDAFRAIKRRADALGCTDAVYAGSPPKWWLSVAEQASKAGAVLVLDKDATRPMLVMSLAGAEQLAGLGNIED